MNKIEFGLSNTHIALVTLGEGNSISFAAWEALPNSKSLVADNQLVTSQIYADNRLILTCSSVTSKNLTISCTAFSDEFKKKYLGWMDSDKATLVEPANPDVHYVALGTEIKGDSEKRRIVFPLCQVVGYTEGERKTVEGGNIAPSEPKLELRVLPVLYDSANDDYILQEVIDQKSKSFAAAFTGTYTLPKPVVL